MNKTSLKKLSTCHDNIQKLAKAVNEVFPIQCICGYRNEIDQQKAYEMKASKLKYPDSKHNKKPSLAGDFVPDPDKNPATIEWGDIKSFELMCLTFEQKADELGIKIRLGRDFKFKDYPHIELAT
jgi:peptidoglycan L-alanyl-D-glutamate endopeptidase CwlK